MKTKPDRPAGRESSLELLRILCMLCIVADHYAGQSGTAVTATLPQALFYAMLGAGSRVGCDVFVVIGAWFLSDRPVHSRRALTLWLGLWLYTVPLTLLCAVLPGGSFSLGSLRWAIFPVSTQQLWFVSQYLLLLCCAPVLNLVLRTAPRRLLRGLLLAVGVFLVGYPTLFAEDGALSDPLWAFVFLYLLTGYLRRYPDARPARWLDTPAAAALAVGFLVLLNLARGGVQYLGLGGKALQYLEYYRTALNAAPNQLCALALFFWFRRRRLGTVPVINRLASATLGVYCIHQTPAVIGLLWTGLFRTGDHVGQPLYALFVIAAVYLGCTAIDLLRQAFVMRPLTGSRWFTALCDRLDRLLGQADPVPGTAAHG